MRVQRSDQPDVRLGADLVGRRLLLFVASAETVVLADEKIGRC